MPLDTYGRYICVTTTAPAADFTVSGSGDLITGSVVAGHGAPTHTPLVATQIYTDLDTGIQYNWLNGAWTP